MPPALTEMEKKYLRMWQLTLYPEGGKWTCPAPEGAVRRFQGQHELTDEIKALLRWQYDSIDIIPERPDLPYQTPLEVYCNYSRDQLFAALGFAKPGSIREGVKYLTPENSDVVTAPTDVFLVTLNKSEKEFSDTTLYEDYSIDRQTFHWQSQSTTTPESKTGQRYIHQRDNGTTVLLFVRSAKQDAYKSSMAYTFLGPAHLMRWEGSQPMTIIYHLDNPIPAKYITKTDSAGVL